MRSYLVPIGLLTLAACSGGGPQTVSSSGTIGAGSGTATTAPPDQYAEFAKATGAHTYVGIGGTQKFSYLTDDRTLTSPSDGQGQQNQLYAGNATTARDSGISITYDPRDGIYQLSVSDPKSGAGTSIRFQDPAHRTDFGGLKSPQWGVPNVNLPADKNVRFLEVGTGTGVIYPGTNTTPPGGEVGSSTDSTTLFFEVPGTTTKFVGYAGYIRNKVSTSQVAVGGVAHLTQNFDIERGAFAYGAQTAQGSVPKTGTGTYSGSMLATMVNNPTLDTTDNPTYFQWISGTSNVTVDFASSKVDLAFNGTVSAPQVDRYTVFAGQTPPVAIAAGSAFAANGTAAIDLVRSGGFSGTITDATFKNGSGTVLQHLTPPATVQDSTKAPGVIAGSSVNGAFYGPGGTIANTELGGGFRIVGGTPDQRIDIVGAFTGAPR
jgi:hypothetical protein